MQWLIVFVAVVAILSGASVLLALLLGVLVLITLHCIAHWSQDQIGKDNSDPKIRDAKIDRHIEFQRRWEAFEANLTKPENMPEDIWEAGLTDTYRRARRANVQAKPIGKAETNRPYSRERKRP